MKDFGKTQMSPVNFISLDTFEVFRDARSAQRLVKMYQIEHRHRAASEANRDAAEREARSPKMTQAEQRLRAAIDASRTLNIFGLMPMQELALANLLNGQKRYGEAIELLLEARRTIESLPYQSKVTVRDFWEIQICLAGNYRKSGDQDAADKLHAECRYMQRDIGAAHTITLRTKYNWNPQAKSGPGPR